MLGKGRRNCRTRRRRMKLSPDGLNTTVHRAGWRAAGAEGRTSATGDRSGLASADIKPDLTSCRPVASQDERSAGSIGCRSRPWGMSHGRVVDGLWVSHGRLACPDGGVLVASEPALVVTVAGQGGRP